MPLKCTCLNCGKAFYVTPSKITQGRGKYCSRDCYVNGRDYGSGPDSPSWKGGRHVRKDGYIAVYSPDHPAAKDYPYILEHRLVMEQKLGRLLDSKEVIHHINGDRTDNRPENLAIMTHSEHHALHIAQIQWSRKYRACIECGTTERKHMGHGMCKRCYDRYRLRKSHVTSVRSL